MPGGVKKQIEESLKQENIKNHVPEEPRGQKRAIDEWVSVAQRIKVGVANRAMESESPGAGMDVDEVTVVDVLPDAFVEGEEQD